METLQCNGNLMLDRLMGAKIFLVTTTTCAGQQTKTGFVPRLMDKIKAHAAKFR